MDTYDEVSRQKYPTTERDEDWMQEQHGKNVKRYLQGKVDRGTQRGQKNVIIPISILKEYLK